jgi:hypothetical protein
MTARRITPLAALAVLTAAFQPLGGQGVEPRLTGVAGSATDIRGVRSGAVSLVPSLLVASRDRGTSLLLSGRGTRFETGEWAGGGGLALEARIPARGALGLTLSGAGDYTITSYDWTFATLEGTSATELRVGGLSLHGGLRGATARTTFEMAGPAPGPGPPATIANTAWLWGPVFGGSYRFSVPGVVPAMSVSYREEHARLEEERFVDRVAEARLLLGRVSLLGRTGWRSAPDERRSFGGVRGAVVVTPALAVIGALESYPSNRLTSTLGGRTLAAGLSLGFGRAGRAPSLPRPAGVAPPAGNMTRISIRAARASSVELAGDWNRWTPVPARRAENGVWYVDLALPPGDYRYAFRIDGREWRIPDGAAAVDDDFGGKSAWLTVRAAERAGIGHTRNKEE